MIEDTALTLRKSMRNIKLNWNDSQAEKIESELIMPLIANAI